METHQEELSCVTVMVEAEQWHLLPAGRRPRQAADDSELKPAHWKSRRREREPQSWAGDPGPAQAGRQEMDRGSLSLLFVPPRAVYFESKTNLMRKPFGAHAPVTFPLGTPVASPRTHPVSLPAPTHLPARSLLLLPPAGQQTPSTCQETSPFRPPSRFSPARLRPGGIPPPTSPPALRAAFSPASNTASPHLPPSVSEPPDAHAQAAVLSSASCTQLASRVCFF